MKLQPKAVELAQLGGGGWFPTVWGNVPKGQKGRASSKMEDKLSSLTEVLIRWYWNLREIGKCCSPSWKQNISGKLQSKKHSQAIRTTQPPANSTQADSEAILPNRTQLVFLRATSLRENGLSRPAKGGSTPAFACQRAAIAPLPCPNLQLISYES